MVAFSIQPSIVQASNVLRRNFDNQNGRSLNQAQLFFEKVYLQSKNNDNEFEEDDLYARTQYNSPTRRGYRPKESGFSGDLLGNQKQLGIALVAIGLLLTIMGMMLFFEGNLLRLGNIGVILGIFLLVGGDKLSSFFFKESRMQATIITAFGVMLVFLGRPRLGLIVEIFGLLNLFGNMFPILVAVGKKLPIIGDVIATIEESIVGSRPHYNTKRPHSYQERKYRPEF